jgi:hypothetical protein
MTISVPEPSLTTRNATLESLADLLRDQSTRKIDVVARPSALCASAGQIVIDQTVPLLGEDGSP